MPTNRETLLCRYHYDPLDRLVDCTPSAQANTRRFYQKNRLATEIQGAVQRSIMQHDDQLLAQQQSQSGTVETRLLATDQQRSVLNALDATQPRPLAYTPYGHRVPEGGLLSLLGFNGERPDPVTGQYLLGNGYRAFNPVLMRFNSPDSWSPFGEGGLNAYAYCVGDPVNRVDPTGHISQSIKTALKRGLPIKSSRQEVLKKIQPRIAYKGKGTLDDLPNEIIDKIIGDLPGKDLGSFATTSKRAHDVVYGSEYRHQKFLNFIDSAESPQERLLKLDSVGVGSVKGIPPGYAVDSGYKRTEALTKIAEINRRPYLPAIEAAESRLREASAEHISMHIRASYGDLW